MILLIDNYDSFSYNVYQYLSVSGREIKVARNDKITIQEIIDLNPSHLVISPGPGHPRDANISNAAISHFSGRIPILGICLGEQCMFEVFGGTVNHAGEIVHGKTSNITHDGKEGYKVSTNLTIGDPKTLPDVLKVTSLTKSGKIMGIRHSKFTVEGVQFHPESVITEYGQLMIDNFLNLCGGTWDLNQSFISDPVEIISKSSNETILEKIYAQRKIDIQAQQDIPGQSEEDLMKYIELGLSPPVINIYDRIKLNGEKVAVMAEFKRASPSKGYISISSNPVDIALQYANGGASVISVLTEPTWFKGSIMDLYYIRMCISSISNRPAILRKEFIFSKYQILEARLNGADSVLLIVKMLNETTLLKTLIDECRKLGMEPIVEVNDENELIKALEAGSKIIGVNNRNLDDFNVDMETTTRISVVLKAYLSKHPVELNMDKRSVILVALSGIKNRDDVVKYENEGVQAILIGEFLMRAENKNQMIKELIGI